MNEIHIELRPTLYPKQRQAIYDPARYVVIEASTKSGKTAGCLLWIVDQACKRPGNYWWVAPILSQARIAYSRLKTALTPYLAYGFTTNDSESSITLPNNSKIWFKGSDNPDSLYGEDVRAAVIDEATRCKEDAWIAVRSTLTKTRGPIRIIGNVTTRGNWAYKMARRAEAGEKNHAYYKLTAYDAVDAGVLDSEEIEDAKRTLTDEVFRALYLAEPSDDGGNPFGLNAIHECITTLSDKEPEVWGVDLAKSQDWTVAIALDEDGNVCQFHRWQAPWPETTDKLAGLIGDTQALVDSTGVGDPILEELQKRCPRIEGLKFTQQSKQQLMEGLAVAIQQDEIGYPDGTIVSELEEFCYEYTRTGVRYSAPPGIHDDCVCALALAWRAYNHNNSAVGVYYL